MRTVLVAITSLGLGCIGSLQSGGMGSGSPGTSTGGDDDDDGNTDPGSGTTTPGMAKSMFEQNVYPIISQPAKCKACHSADAPEGNTYGFVADTVADAYSTITTFPEVVGNYQPATAGILAEIAAGHFVTYSGSDVTAITDWLNEEVSERAASGGVSVSPQGQLYNQFSSCMYLDDFKTANMSQSWSNTTAQDNETNEPCMSCHYTGGYGTIINDLGATGSDGTPGLFTTMSTNFTYFQPWFTMGSGSDGTTPQVVVNLQQFTDVGTDQPPHGGHPRFNNNIQGINALTKFYDLVMARVGSAGTGNCDQGVQLNPPAP